MALSGRASRGGQQRKLDRLQPETGGRTFSYAAEIQDSYVHETGDAASYGDRLGDLLLGMVRAIGGVLDHHATLLEYAREPLLWVATGLTLLGLGLAVRHRSWLPVLVVASTIVMLPLVNPKYDPILNGRYLAPILPLCLIWVGLALEWLAGCPPPPPTIWPLRFAGSPRPPPPPSGRRGTGGLLRGSAAWSASAWPRFWQRPSWSARSGR